MPQGEEVGAGNSTKATYKRKRENVRRSGAQGVGGRAAQMNPNYLSALPGMVRDVEQIAAGKLLQSGATLKLRDIRESGVIEKKKNTGKKKKVNPVTAVLARSKNLKGVKGSFDVEELANVDPELRTLLNNRKATSGAAKKKVLKEKNGSTEPGTGEGDTESGARAVGGGLTAPRAISGKRGGSGRVASLMEAGGGGSASGEPSVFATDAEIGETFGSDFL